MASLEKADALLEELRSASFKPAQEELEEVRQFAKGKGFTEELRQWDVTFWAERLREAKYDITDEELRPFFALPSVLEGLFKVPMPHLRNPSPPSRRQGEEDTHMHAKRSSFNKKLTHRSTILFRDSGAISQLIMQTCRQACPGSCSSGGLSILHCPCKHKRP